MQALAMGGYGGYVWAAFGFTIVLMIGLLWQSWRLQQRRTDELAGLRRTLRGDTPGGDGRPATPNVRRVGWSHESRTLSRRQPDRVPAHSTPDP